MTDDEIKAMAQKHMEEIRDLKWKTGTSYDMEEKRDLIFDSKSSYDDDDIKSAIEYGYSIGKNDTIERTCEFARKEYKAWWNKEIETKYCNLINNKE